MLFVIFETISFVYVIFISESTCWSRLRFVCRIKVLEFVIFISELTDDDQCDGFPYLLIVRYFWFLYLRKTNVVEFFTNTIFEFHIK